MPTLHSTDRLQLLDALDRATSPLEVEAVIEAIKQFEEDAFSLSLLRSAQNRRRLIEARLLAGQRVYGGSYRIAR